MLSAIFHQLGWVLTQNVTVIRHLSDIDSWVKDHKYSFERVNGGIYNSEVCLPEIFNST